MPIETIPEAEPRIAEDDGIDAVHPDWLPIVQTLLAGYRIIAENFISFTVVTLLLAVIHFSFVETSPLLLANSGPGVRTVVLHAAITLTSFVCTSLVLAIAGIRWYSGILPGAQRRRSDWFGSREKRFAACTLLFYLVLDVPDEVSRSAWREIALLVADQIEQRIGYPVELFWPTVNFLWHVLVITWLFFTLPAIALDVERPLENGIRMARRAFPSLFLVYLIGLVPWFALNKLGVPALYLQVDFERLVFATAVLNMWIMTCSLALVGAAYRAITARELLKRVSIDFE